MTRDEIMQLARDAGIEFQQHRGITGALNTYTCGGQSIEKMERFAALVAAEEREACAISCEVNAARWINAGGKQWYAAHECASAIRARGQS